MTLDEIIEAIGVKPFHREKAGVIYCGSFIDVLKTLPSADIFDLVCTSPPYNVGMEYEKVLPWPEYYNLLRALIWESRRLMKRGGVLATVLPKEVKLPKDQIEDLGRRVERIAERFNTMCTDDYGLLPRESIIWAKGSEEGEPYSHISATGSDNNIYIRSCCEIIGLHSKGRYHYDGGTGRRGREAVPYMEETKDIWWIRPDHGNGHPCPFPVKIPYQLIQLFTLNHKFTPIVLDPFCGKGTTAIAAKKLKRFYVGIDKEERYCAMAADQLRQEELPL